MDSKEILKAARADSKRNFWIYLAAGVLIGVVSGITNGDIFSYLGNLHRFVASIQNGEFVAYLQGTNSDFMSFYKNNFSMSPNGLGIFGILLSFFVVNPLLVGNRKVFLDGIKNKPDILSMTIAFRERYLNVTGVMFLREILMELIILAITLVYVILTCIPVFVTVTLTENASVYASVAAYAICIFVCIALFVTYMIYFINITYNFFLIPSILTEHSDYNFSTAYNENKKMIKGKKWQLFKIDFHYCKYIIISIIVPVASVVAGMIMTMQGWGGELFIISGIFLIAPVVFLNIFISILRNSAWAHIYNELKITELQDETAEKTVSSYEPPMHHEPISYVADEKNDTDDNLQDGNIN